MAEYMVSVPVAVVGSGYWGKNLVRNFHELGALAAICDSDAGRHQELTAQYPGTRIIESFDLLLQDASIAAVAIATPAETHGALARAALLAGKDVYVEKPLCLSVREAESLVELAAQNDRILMVGHLLWYHPAVLKLKALIQAGELGRLQYIYSNRLNLGKIRREENILWSFAPHDISVILGLLEEMPIHIQAQGGNYLSRGIADVTMSLLAFPSGVKAHVFVSWLHPFKEQKLVVVGDKKMAVFDDTEAVDKLRLYPHSIGWKNEVPIVNKADAEPVPLEATEPLRAECLHFLECVENKIQPRTDGAEGLRVLRVLEQCQAALEQTTAKLPESTKMDEQAYFAHESAFIDAGVKIGAGSSIWHVSHILSGTKLGRDCKIGQNVVVGPNVTIGNGVKIQNNVSVYEGVTLEDGVFCGPSMVFTNVFNPRSEVPRMHELRPTLVKRGATLGANSTILCGITIGSYALIGAGAVVTKDVPNYAIVMGNPSRRTGWVCACGVKIEFKNDEAACTCGLRFTQTTLGVVPQ